MVVAQLVEQLLPIPEVRSSNPVIGNKLYWTLFSVNCIEKTKINKRGWEWPIKKRKKRPGIAHFLKRTDQISKEKTKNVFKYFLTEPEWSDVKIKSSPNFSKVAQNVTTTVFTSNSQNVTKYVGKLCRKFCHQELQKWPNQVTLHRTTQFYLDSPFNQISAASTTLKNAKSSRRFGIISKAEPKIAPKSSVNKFGKILPLRQNFKSLWAILVCFI